MKVEKSISCLLTSVFILGFFARTVAQETAAGSRFNIGFCHVLLNNRLYMSNAANFPIKWHSQMAIFEKYVESTYSITPPAYPSDVNCDVMPADDEDALRRFVIHNQKFTFQSYHQPNLEVVYVDWKPQA